jgi:hypothetical protein
VDSTLPPNTGMALRWHHGYIPAINSNKHAFPPLSERIRFPDIMGAVDAAE